MEDVLEATSLVEDEARVAALAPAAQAFLDGVSPASSASRLVAPVYLRHDRGGDFIPWSESATMPRLIRPAACHEVDLFEHVEPAATSVPVLARDGRHVARLLADVLSALDEPPPAR